MRDTCWESIDILMYEIPLKIGNLLQRNTLSYLVLDVVLLPHDWNDANRLIAARPKTNFWGNIGKMK